MLNRTVEIVEDLGESLSDIAAGPAVVQCLCKCGYCWTSRLPVGQRPKACPDCKSRTWDKPSVRRRKRFTGNILLPAGSGGTA